MQFLEVSLEDSRVTPLLVGIEREYVVRYGINDEMKHAVAPEFEPPDGAFLILLDGTTTIAGGGYRRYDERTCEIKRMWTHDAYRRLGHAERLLDALRQRARQAGYTRLILETGPRQPEAASLYLKLGYRPIPVYGRYPEALAFAADL